MKVESCTSCEITCNSADVLRKDDKSYCDSCDIIAKEPMLPAFITFFAWAVLLIGFNLWPESSYSHQLSFIDYMPFIYCVVSGALSFLLLSTVSRALTFLRKIAQNTMPKK